LTDVRGVVTSPDKPAGRGYETQPTPVKAAASGLGLPILQPVTLKDGTALEGIKKWGEVDAALVVAYGKLIPRAVFSWPRFGTVNAHFSLLPKFRGAAPVQWALIRGEKITGVSLFQIEESLDTGPLFSQRSVEVSAGDNSQTLRAKLVEAGLPAVEEWVKAMEAGRPAFRPQEGEATLAPTLKKEDGLIRFETMSADEAAGLVRGTFEWPGAYIFVNGKRVKVLQAEPGDAASGGRPGEILRLERGRGFLIKCLKGALWILRVKPEGRSDMDAESFWNGARLEAGRLIGENK
jgi:methionyl-tRNA formyltransferase